MARYYRRRYTRVVRPKKKWATNIVALAAGGTVSNNTVLFQQVLCQNSPQTGTPTPTIVKTGNFKLQCDAYFNLSQASAVELSLYIIYVPEATTIDSYNDAIVFVNRHPEWIMAWRYASFDYVSGTNNIETINMSSRLKRNLNSGDSIMLLALGSTGTNTTFNSRGLGGKCQFWTCAN